MLINALNPYKATFVAIIVSISTCLFSCEKEADPVVISTFEPTSGDYESEVTITGSNFDSNTEANTVLFNGEVAEVLTATATELVVAVPVGVTTGKITVKAGGQKTTTSADFTVTAGSWNNRANLNKAVELGNDLCFSVGGDAYIHITQHMQDGNWLDASLWMYSSSNNTWTQKKELSVEQSSFQATVFGTADKGYLLQYQKLWEYSPANNSWVEKNALPVALVTDKVFGVFYMSSVNRACAITSDGDWFIYNPVDDVWSQNQDAPFAASLLTNGGQGLVQGTSDRGFLIIGKEVWKYNSTENLWTQLLSFPGDEPDFTFGISNELYAGYTGVDYDNNFWVYKEGENKWIRKATMGGGFRYWAVYFTLNDKGYLGLGVNTSNDVFVHDFHRYNP